MSETTAAQLPVEKRLFSPGPKRILTLDGGGVRGMITVAFLSKLEADLRDATDRPDLVLADVFDLIAGTSVGSMLATMLSLGYDMAEVEQRFRTVAANIFKGRETKLAGMRRFDARPLMNAVMAVTDKRTLASPDLRTGLLIMAKRVDTGSVWALSNNPRMPFYEDGMDKDLSPPRKLWDGNRHYQLSSLVRASTAVPFLFTPKEITILTDDEAEDQVGLFVDGAISPHNNPALQAFMMASLPAYKLDWKLSPRDLLIISIGAGSHRVRVGRKRQKVVKDGFWTGFFLSKQDCDDINEAAFAAQVVGGIIADNAQLVLKLMQSLSSPRFCWTINSEVGSLDADFLLAGSNVADTDRDLFRFQRLDLPLEPKLVPPEFDITASAEARAALQPIDRAENIDDLYRMASTAASRQISIADFDGFI